ncbi:hypothetical protein [Tsukamurella soli]|uniref:PH domain-containing protein n=1 Tax=Tsukamurella soli TaxID=644556 RepID=A0ABP8KC82_9ACTN
MVGARAGSDARAVLVLLFLVVAGVAVFRLGRAGLAGRAAPGPTATLARVRSEHRVVSHGWLELTPDPFAPDGSPSGAGALWQPVYFHPGLLAIRTGTVGRVSRRGRAHAVVTSDGVVALPCGRARRTPPPGRLIDAPAYSPDALAERAATVGTLRRRLATDAPLGTAGLAPALMWCVAFGSGAALPGSAIVGLTCGFWYAAVMGTDPA